MLKKKKNKDFIFINKRYIRLQLMLYILTIFVTLIVYFFIKYFLSKNSMNLYLVGLTSFLLGVYLVFNKDNLVKRIDEYIMNKKIKHLKKNSKKNLERTIKKIPKTASKNIKKVNISVNLKDKYKFFKENFKKKKNKKDYIEIK